MTQLRTASSTVVLTALLIVSYRAFEENKRDFLNSLAFSVMASLVEIETGGIESAEFEAAPDGILIAEATEISPARGARETLATLVLALPPLKPLSKPLCAARPPVQLASYRAGEVRDRYDFFHAPEIHTEIRVVTSTAAQTGDWTKLVASCREKSLKVCIEKSKSRQRVVILESGDRDPVGLPVPTVEQPAS